MSIRRRDPGPHREIGIVLLGYMGAGNFGNEGSLDAVTAGLRRAIPGARLSSAVAVPDVVAARTALPAVPFDRPPFARRWMRGLNKLLLGVPASLANVWHALRALRGQHAVVVPGTGILDDYGTGPRGMPTALLRWTVLARLLGVKVLLVSIGAGPIVDPRTRALMRATARLATFRSYRDAGSKAFVTSLGIDTSRDAVTPDVAFSLPLPPLDTAPRRSEPLTIGLGVIDYRGWHHDGGRSTATHEAYVGRIIAICTRLLEQGHRVRLLTGAEADWPVVQRIRQQIEAAGPALDDGRLLVHRARNLADVMAEASRCDAVIASRFHNVVCALAVGRPVLSVGYADKNDQLLQAVGLGDFCQHIEQLDVARLERQLADLLARRDAASATIRRVVDGYRVRLAEQEVRLAAHIAAPGAPATEAASGMASDPPPRTPELPSTSTASLPKW